MELLKKIFAPVVQYYEKIKAEEEERRRLAQMALQERQRKAYLKEQERLRREIIKKQKEEKRRQKTEYIKSNGKRICAIKKLNGGYKFKKFESLQRFKRTCNSKAQLDNFNIDNHMLLTIEDSPDFFKQLVKAVKYNRSEFSRYENQYTKILYNANRNEYTKIAEPTVIEADELERIELAECKKIKLTPVTDFTIELIVCYTSPQGKNEYAKTFKFTCFNIEHYLNEYEILQKNKESAVYQRQLMTPKLRYEIMKRDKFKCTICGRSQNDGAKLHVDHIKPVSKGGKTVESNLRTLCDICNLGKSNSYDPYGLN